MRTAVNTRASGFPLEASMVNKHLGQQQGNPEEPDPKRYTARMITLCCVQCFTEELLKINTYMGNEQTM